MGSTLDSPVITHKAATAAVITSAALRGATTTSEVGAARVSRRRRHIAEATSVVPKHYR
ncbi:hypothetical protein [Nocardioides mangrovicus]|uniref:hypothetical protein n=1 Tax=Nocardioides mangrovicus TaxID=2478913 RepID=UPI001314E644|nr:hypothetical protein [Nocardioides mangrovicus]